MTPLNSNEIFGNWVSVLLPINTDDSINYLKLEEEIDILISTGVNGIYSNGTAGELYTLTENDFDKISVLLANKCNSSGIPFQIGCSQMSPQISLERLKRVIVLKPSAIQVILPDWFPPSIPEIIDFLKVMGKAADPIGLVLYNPPHAKIKLKPEDFYQIMEAGIQLVGCKVSGGDESWHAAMKKLVPDLSVFVPGHHLATGFALGAHGSYSNMACLHPQVAQKWYETMVTDIESALEIEKRIQIFMNKCIMPYIDKQNYSNQAIDKFLAAIGDWTDIGTRLRWPYKWISEDEVIKVRRVARNILPEFFNNSLI